MFEKQEVPLKYQKIQPFSLLRGDVILHEGSLWECVIKNAALFKNLQSKEQKQITQSWYFRVNKLDLIPQSWEVIQGKIKLKGQQLGLGPIHNIEIEGMRSFEEMDIIKRQTQKGRKVNYRVVVLQTQISKKYLLVAIQFM